MALEITSQLFALADVTVVGSLKTTTRASPPYQVSDEIGNSEKAKHWLTASQLWMQKYAPNDAALKRLSLTHLYQ